MKRGTPKQLHAKPNQDKKVTNGDIETLLHILPVKKNQYSFTPLKNLQEQIYIIK